MYKLLLILKYLRRRRIAWVSLAAVMLCTTMVIVVISVMGGWLRMFEESARGMTGDLVIRAPGLAGFPYYDEIVEKLEQKPFVVGAVPQIQTLGLVNIYGQKTVGVQVFGVQIDNIGKVNNWPKSLYRQESSYVDAGRTPPAKKTFDLRPANMAYVGRLPPDVTIRPWFAGFDSAVDRAVDWLPRGVDFEVRRWLDLFPVPLGDGTDPAWNAIIFSRVSGELIYTAKMTKPIQTAFANASKDKLWESAIRKLARESNEPGLIAGARVIEVGKDEDGKIKGREAWKYRELWAKLTVLGIGADQSFDVASDKAERTYWIVDDSRTGMWQYDGSAVYVAFDVLQRDLSMDAKEVEDRITGQKIKQPARASEIHVKLKENVSPEGVRAEVEKLVTDIINRHDGDRAFRVLPKVETWRQSSGKYLDAIEKEKLLVVFLFGIISVVAVFLIFCIFYMIVAEKTRDIGIIKSVGATNGGVAGIFLGYGLVIGLLGSGMGLLFSYLIVHNINEIHDWMGRKLGLVVWNPETYAFDTIPNHLNTGEVALIMGVAILASVLGALVPAIRAARMHPVEALRWE